MDFYIGEEDENILAYIKIMITIIMDKLET